MKLIEIIAKEEIGTSFLGMPKYETNVLSITYNIEENSIYYNDLKKEKPIKTGKDLARSMYLLKTIVDRFDAFGVEWDIREFNVPNFIITVAKSEKPESACFILLGTDPYNVPIFNSSLFNLFDPDDKYLYDYNIEVGDKKYNLEKYLNKISSVMEASKSLNGFYVEKGKRNGK